MRKYLIQSGESYRSKQFFWMKWQFEKKNIYYVVGKYLYYATIFHWYSISVDA